MHIAALTLIHQHSAKTLCRCEFAVICKLQILLENVVGLLQGYKKRHPISQQLEVDMLSNYYVLVPAQ